MRTEVWPGTWEVFLIRKNPSLFGLPVCHLAGHQTSVQISEREAEAAELWSGVWLGMPVRLLSTCTPGLEDMGHRAALPLGLGEGIL